MYVCCLCVKQCVVCFCCATFMKTSQKTRLAHQSVFFLKKHLFIFVGNCFQRFACDTFVVVTLSNSCDKCDRADHRRFSRSAPIRRHKWQRCRQKIDTQTCHKQRFDFGTLLRLFAAASLLAALLCRRNCRARASRAASWRAVRLCLAARRRASVASVSNRTARRFRRPSPPTGCCCMSNAGEREHRRGRPVAGVGW